LMQILPRAKNCNFEEVGFIPNQKSHLVWKEAFWDSWRLDPGIVAQWPSSLNFSSCYWHCFITICLDNMMKWFYSPLTFKCKSYLMTILDLTILIVKCSSGRLLWGVNVSLYRKYISRDWSNLKNSSLS
jgi:hypothetical protein